MSKVSPTRAVLLSRYKKAELFGRLWSVFDLSLIALSLYLIDFPLISRQPIEAAVLFGLSTGPTLLSLAYLFAQNMKAVENLRQDIKFGSISKPDLQDIIRQVCQRMSVSVEQVRFYVTAEKRVNAAALALGLGWLVPAMRRVYLNRATIHALSKEELGTVIAHELAHIYRYPLYYQKGLFVHLLSSAFLALSIWSNGYQMILAIAAIGVYYFCLNWIFGRYSRVVEYLCDDCGAEVMGVYPALRAEFLVSQHSALLSQAYKTALERKLSGHNISQKDIQNIIDDSLTFDPISTEAFQKELEKRFEKHEEKNNTSFYHFIKGLITADGPDNRSRLEDELQRLKLAAKATTLKLPDLNPLSPEWFSELVSRIEQNPGHVLFPVPEELSDNGSTHPAPRKRIAYLWHNYANS